MTRTVEMTEDEFNVVFRALETVHDISAEDADVIAQEASAWEVVQNVRRRADQSAARRPSEEPRTS